jgi:PII-like signaling protein
LIIGTLHLVDFRKNALQASARAFTVVGRAVIMFTGRGKQLTVFVTETDHYHHQALYMAIIEMLRREGCGATAIRGVAGFGASTLIHTTAILRLSLDQPLVITVVDRPERIERVLEPLREMAPNALIVVQDLEVAQSGAPFK